ncbi:MAG: nucleotide exchange factor GrpE [Phycisphaerae bacterium]|nr:nucleotide exchange factor GrpE [Phycisphaerae bacterium]
MSKKKNKNIRSSQFTNQADVENPADRTHDDQPDLNVVDSVTDTEQQLGELQLKYQRLAADYQNYQKRALKQIEQAGEFSKENLVKSLLPVLDNFEHALDKGTDTQDPNAILEGVKIVYDHMISIFTAQGLEPIVVHPGCDFNPALHEGLMQEVSDQVAPNAVVRELARGYVMNERTIRPAKVSVAKAPPQEQPEPSQKQQPQQPTDPSDLSGDFNENETR